MRKERPFREGLANWSSRPVPAFQIGPVNGWNAPRSGRSWQGGCSASDKAAPSIATLRRSQSLGNRRYDDRAISGGGIPFNELVKGLDVSRPPEQEALALVAIITFKELQFGGGLDPFGEHRETGLDPDPAPP